MQVHHGGAGGGDCLPQRLAAVFELAVQDDDLGQQLGCDLPAGSASDLTRPHGGQRPCADRHR
jgi:hypothetical protein